MLPTIVANHHLAVAVQSIAKDQFYFTEMKKNSQSGMNCTKCDREIGKFLSQKSVGEPGKIRRTAKFRLIWAVLVNEPLAAKTTMSILCKLDFYETSHIGRYP